MGPVHLHVRYRPIRIGWCIQNDHEEFRKALRLTHTLWGGRFNPIIPLAEPDLARSLVKTFRIDCLYCLSESAEGTGLQDEFKYLIWPGFERGLFMEGPHGRIAAFLDVYHPVRQIFQDAIEGRDHPTCTGTLFRWDAEDPLADVFLATFGGYPAPNETGMDYDGFFRKHLSAKETEIPKGSGIPKSAFQEFTPSVLTAFDLEPVTYDWGRDDPGLYYGDCADLTDLVNFWNLRASGIEVLFYDSEFRPRFDEVAQNYLAELRARPKDPTGWRDQIAMWNKSHEHDVDLSGFGENLTLSSLSIHSWNGLNIKPSVMGFEEKSVLGSASENGVTSVAFELPPKPFIDEPSFFTQKVVVSVHPLINTENIVLKPPFLPELNEYYGREAFFEYDRARSEREGLGIVTELTTANLTIRALDVRTLVKKLFEVFGISARPSPAGLVGLRLIEQMGGLRGCSVFKIAGVRELIRAYPPERSFTRSGAIMAIRQQDSASGKVQFERYERLYIDSRESRRLSPEDAFTYLLKRGVFRAGLRLTCPNCELESWVHMDDVRTITECEYCGHRFNVTPQLRDRDWAFRRSGLFGRDDNQGGGIPVALTLQQIQRALHGRVLAYTTGTELDLLTAKIRKCETDFVLLVEAPATKKCQVVIGECKSGGEIAEDDAEKLGLVADALENGQRCDAFVVFSKTRPFTPEEVGRCKRAQGRYRRRVILLSDRELEPYFMYELAEQEFEIRRSAVSLEDMAQATQNIYFEPRPTRRIEPAQH